MMMEASVRRTSARLSSSIRLHSASASPPPPLAMASPTAATTAAAASTSSSSSSSSSSSTTPSSSIATATTSSTPSTTTASAAASGSPTPFLIPSNELMATLSAKAKAKAKNRPNLSSSPIPPATQFLPPHPHGNTNQGAGNGLEGGRRRPGKLLSSFRRKSSGMLNDECLQLNAMCLTSPPPSPLNSPRRRSSLTDGFAGFAPPSGPVSLSASPTPSPSASPRLSPASYPSPAPVPLPTLPAFNLANAPNPYSHRRRSSGGVCAFNFTPALPTQVSNTFATPLAGPPPALPQSSSIVPLGFPGNPVPDQSLNPNLTPADNFHKPMLKARRLVNHLPGANPPLSSLIQTVASLPPLPPPAAGGSTDDKAEFAVPRATQTKRKVSQVEPEPIPVPAAILNRRRGAISFVEPPAQLKELVERMAKRAKHS